jgi:hypothetical protein
MNNIFIMWLVLNLFLLDMGVELHLIEMTEGKKEKKKG